MAWKSSGIPDYLKADTNTAPGIKPVSAMEKAKSLLQTGTPVLEQAKTLFGVGGGGLELRAEECPKEREACRKGRFGI